MTLSQLAVLGPGLIGGSIALGAKERGLATRVIVVDRRGGASLEEDERHRVADEWVRLDDTETLRRTYAESELIVLAAPVQAIIQALPLALASGATVTDAGSTKLSIWNAAAPLEGVERYVPAHPMAGHPTGGLSNARPDLFQDRRWLLCPALAAPEAIEKVRELATGLGAEVIEIDVETHDRAVALTSHLPQILASGLAALAHEQGATVAAGPGFASATRVAGGGEEMWRDIFSTNSGPIGTALEQLAQELSAVAQGFHQGDPTRALDLLERARRAKLI